MCRCGHLRLPLLAVAVLLALPNPSVLARSKTDNPVARDERAKGTVALNLGRYDEAVEHLSQAYSLTQDPVLLFSLGQAYRLAGKPEKALASYSAFLRAARPSGKYRAQIERAAAEIETITSFVLNRPAERPAQEKRLDSAMTVPPPVEEQETASPPDSEPEQVTDATPTEPPPLALAPPPPPPPPPPALSLSSQTNSPAPPPPSHIYGKWWFWTSVGVALAAGGVAAWWFTRPENQMPPSTYGALRVLQ